MFKRLFITILLTFTAVFCFGQRHDSTGNYTNITAFKGGASMVNYFQFPGVFNPLTFDSCRMIWFSGGKIYVHDCNSRVQILTLKDSSLIKSWAVAGTDNQTLGISGDTLSIVRGNTIILSFIRAQDTAAMLSGYTRLLQFMDSISALRSGLLSRVYNKYATIIYSGDSIAVDTTLMATLAEVHALLQGKVNYTDTSGMLAGYTRLLALLDTASAHMSLIQQRVKYADTSAMLANYIRKGWGVLYGDTSTMLSPYQRKGLSVQYTDTSAMLAGYARQLALLDTALAHMALIQSRVKYSDTTSMLAGYARALALIDTAAAIRSAFPSTSGFVKYTDTAGMLLGYARALALLDTAAAHMTLIQNRVKYGDTASILSGYAKALALLDTASAIRSGIISYTGGYGISITSGSIAVDTTKMIPYTDTNSSFGLTTKSYMRAQHYLTSYTETDPIFTASIAYYLTATDTTHYNTAYQKYVTAISWSGGTLTLTKNDGTTLLQSLDGRYLQSYTETDPVATAKTVTGTNGYGITGLSGAGQTLGSNPNLTPAVDTTVIIPYTDTNKATGIATKSWVALQGFGLVSSVSNSDGTLIFTPTTNAVVGKLNVSANIAWLGTFQFNKGTILPSLNATPVTPSTGVTLFANSSNALSLVNYLGGVYQIATSNNSFVAINGYGITGLPGAQALTANPSITPTVDTTVIVAFTDTNKVNGVATKAFVNNGMANVAYLNVQQKWTKGQAGTPVVLTYSTTVTPDFSQGNNFVIQLTGNVTTWAQPLNLYAGQVGTMDFWQDGTGSRTITTWAFPYSFPSSGTVPTLSTGKYLHDILSYKVDYYSTATVTISNASPGVVTWTAHGLISGQKVQFSTTGSLPTGLSTATTYWVNVVNANTFNVATSLANLQAGTYVNTSSAGSGTQTCTAASITIYTTQDSR
jgi:hypothetical protein